MLQTQVTFIMPGIPNRLDLIGMRSRGNVALFPGCHVLQLILKKLPITATLYDVGLNHQRQTEFKSTSA